MDLITAQTKHKKTATNATNGKLGASMENTEFDVWSNNKGNLFAKRASKRFVDDADAPYGFSRHEVRVTASNGREALSEYRKLKRRTHEITH